MPGGTAPPRAEPTNVPGTPAAPPPPPVGTAPGGPAPGTPGRGGAAPGGGAPGAAPAGGPPRPLARSVGSSGIGILGGGAKLPRKEGPTISYLRRSAASGA